MAVARAALSRAELARADVAPPPDARLDLAPAAQDSTGVRRAIGEVLSGRPALVFVDHRCDTLRGTKLQLLLSAIETAHLDPANFRLLAIGIDPRTPPTATRDMARMEMPLGLRPACEPTAR